MVHAASRRAPWGSTMVTSAWPAFQHFPCVCILKMSSFNVDVRSPSAYWDPKSFCHSRYPWFRNRENPWWVMCNPSCRIPAVRLLRVSLCETFFSAKKNAHKNTGKQRLIGNFSSIRKGKSPHFWYSDKLWKCIVNLQLVILDGWSSLLTFWTFAAKSQKAERLGVLRGWVACRCDKLMTWWPGLNDFNLTIPKMVAEYFQRTQVTPACGPRVDSIFERSLITHGMSWSWPCRLKTRWRTNFHRLSPPSFLRHHKFGMWRYLWRQEMSWNHLISCLKVGIFRCLPSMFPLNLPGRGW